jgi:phasin family protein
MNDLTKFTETAASQCFDACRSQFEGGLALANALVAGAERMRVIQLAAAQEIQAKHAAIAERSAKASNVQDLLLLQATLMADYCSGALGYWTKLAVLAKETQSELAALAQKQGSEAMQKVSANANAAAATSAGSPGFASAVAPESLVKVLQTAYDAARGANEAFVKAFTGAAIPPSTETKKPAKALTRPA